MPIKELNTSAEYMLNQLQLKSEIKDTIRLCVQRYTLPDAWSDKLVWVLHRISNAIKSIFGRSDWQKTRELIQERAIQFFKTVEKGRAMHEIEKMPWVRSDVKNFKIAETLLDKAMKEAVPVWADEVLTLCYNFYKLNVPLDEKITPMIDTKFSLIAFLSNATNKAIERLGKVKLSTNPFIHSYA